MSKDAASFFNQEQVQKHLIPEWKSREKMICMRIDDFLAMAKPGHEAWKVTRIESAITEGSKLTDIPMLIAYTSHHDAVMQVCGHEGRHRAKVLKTMGMTTMPVILKSDIRWSEQSDPDRFDYRNQWPESLISENGESQIPFPVTRHDAMTPYTSQPLRNTLEARMDAAQELLDACELQEIGAKTIEAWNATRNDGAEPQKEIILKGWIKEDINTLTKDFYVPDETGESMGEHRKAWAYFDGEDLYDFVIQDSDYKEIWTPDIERAKAKFIPAASLKASQPGM